MDGSSNVPMEQRALRKEMTFPQRLETPTSDHIHNVKENGEVLVVFYASACSVVDKIKLFNVYSNKTMFTLKEIFIFSHWCLLWKLRKGEGVCDEL